MDPRERQIIRTIGRNMKAERARRELTQEAVARLVGMHTTQVARMERGLTDSGVAKYVRLAWAMGITPAELFQGLDDPVV